MKKMKNVQKTPEEKQIIKNALIAAKKLRNEWIEDNNDPEAKTRVLILTNGYRVSMWLDGQEGHNEFWVTEKYYNNSKSFFLLEEKFEGSFNNYVSLGELVEYFSQNIELNVVQYPAGV